MVCLMVCLMANQKVGLMVEKLVAVTVETMVVY